MSIDETARVTVNLNLKQGMIRNGVRKRER